MIIRNALKIAVKAIRSNKIRAFLTMLGIIIGIAAVITVVAVGAGGQSLIVNQIKSVGSNLVGVLPGASDENGPPATAMGMVITTLGDDDLEALSKPANVTDVVAATAYVKGASSIIWQNRSIDGSFTGVTNQYINVEDTKVIEGRFFTEEENKAQARVVVIGSQIVDDLFGGLDPLGQKIKIDKTIFEVVGIMEPRGVTGMQNQDNQIFVPLKTAQKLLLGINHVSFIRLRIGNEWNIDQAINDIKVTLREQHGITDPSQDDFSVRSQKQALNVLGTITNALKFFLSAIAGLSLVVGGIGIMNIMLMSVRERTREIGLRKAIGATNLSIQLQFLVESVVLTFIGAIIGIVLGSLVSFGIAMLARYFGYDWDLIISANSIFMSCVMALLVGVGFGYYPARKAAQLNPIDALRYE